MPQGPIAVAAAKTPGNVLVSLNLDTGGNLKTVTQAGSVQSVTPVGASSYNDAVGSAGHQIKTGAGVFQTFNVNTAGTASTAVLYDGTSTSGTKLATIDTAALYSHIYQVAFTTGLFIVSSIVTPADITVGYY